MAGLTGPPAFESLRAWHHWQFESLSGFGAAHLAVNCDLPLAESRPGDGSRAGGSLRGLALRHLIEWAMRYRQSCTLMVTSQRRSGILAFEAGTIRSSMLARAGSWESTF